MEFPLSALVIMASFFSQFEFDGFYQSGFRACVVCGV